MGLSASGRLLWPGRLLSPETAGAGTTPGLGRRRRPQIQFAPGPSGAFTTIQTVTLSGPGNCYFDVRVKFPASGTVRLSYGYSSPGGAGACSRSPIRR